MKNIISIFIILFNFSVFAKRSAPVEIKPIEKNGNEYSFRIDHSACEEGKKICGMQVFLISKELSTQKLNWETALYQKIYDPKLETDVQTIFPRSLKLRKSKYFQIIDEKGAIYLVKLKTGELVKPLKSIIYPSSKN